MEVTDQARFGEERAWQFRLQLEFLATTTPFVSKKSLCKISVLDNHLIDLPGSSSSRAKTKSSTGDCESLASMDMIIDHPVSGWTEMHD
jgi:hypothetical protein